MPEKQSKKPAPKRRFTDKKKHSAVLYAGQHGAMAAAEKFGVHTSVIYAWRKRDQEPAAPSKAAPEVYLLCRKLQGALRAERKTGGELTDVEIYATLLVRALIGKKT